MRRIRLLSPVAGLGRGVRRPLDVLIECLVGAGHGRRFRLIWSAAFDAYLLFRRVPIERDSARVRDVSKWRLRAKARANSKRPPLPDRFVSADIRLDLMKVLGFFMRFGRIFFIILILTKLLYRILLTFFKFKFLYVTFNFILIQIFFENMKIQSMFSQLYNFFYNSLCYFLTKSEAM